MNAVFESPIPLAIAGLCLVVLAMARLQTAVSRGAVATAIAGALLVAAGWIVDGAVTTDREQIEADIAALVQDFKAGDVPAVQAKMRPPGLKTLAAAAMKIVTMEDERLTDTNVTVDGDDATARFRLNGDFTIASGSFGTVRKPTRWELTLVREGADWTITDVAEMDPLSGERLDRFKSIPGLR